MAKYRLFAPGPTPLPDSVRAALAEPMVHHRTAAFAARFGEVRAALRWLFQTETEVLCLAATGTGAMDGAVCNLLSPGDTAIYVDGGKFGARWGDILRAYGIEAVPISVPWGHSVTPEAVAATLRRVPQAKALYLQACETSTGCMHPFAEVAQLCAQTDTLSVVDGITAVGVCDVAMDRQGIDVLITGSQKALMAPPGLAFAALSARAWDRAQTARLPRFYLDFRRELAAARTGQTAWTSSVSLIAACHAALQLLQAETHAQMFARHARLAQQVRHALLGMGCTLYAQHPAQGLTAVCPPAGVAPAAVVTALREQHNLTIVGGQDQAKGHIFRCAHMGYVDDADVTGLLGCLQQVLAQLQGSAN